jgi:hypothetical protein
LRIAAPAEIVPHDRPVDSTRRFLVYAVVMHVGHNADNLLPRIGVALADSLADCGGWILPELARQLL